MFNLEEEFKYFYTQKVQISDKKVEELLEKKEININRLKTGLKEYNNTNQTNHKLLEHIIQGSVSMKTIIQHEDNNYDIDVAIVFDKDSIPDSTIAVKNIVVNALRKKCKQFNVEPEFKTNCVRINYQDGYHIDFAIYRKRYKDNNDFIYEHCGSEWRSRDPKAISKWFYKENKRHGNTSIERVRLLKAFCKSREGWANMPGGLIQSVLINETNANFDRMDERFYYTLKSIQNRLFQNKEVYNPTDPSQNLKLVKSDDSKMNNLCRRLNNNLKKLDILFDSNCTKKQALTAWGNFFNEDFIDLSQKSFNKSNLSIKKESNNISEMFIKELFPEKIIYNLTLDCQIYNMKQKGKYIGMLRSFLKQKQVLLPNYKLRFVAQTNVPEPYDVYWKVKNNGLEAEKRNCLRGEIFKNNSLHHIENTLFKGKHFIECYIVKDGVCVAKNRIYVPIKFQ